MLNWIVWNRTVYMYKMVLVLITYNGWCAIKPKQTLWELLHLVYEIYMQM